MVVIKFPFFIAVYAGQLEVTSCQILSNALLQRNSTHLSNIVIDCNCVAIARISKGDIIQALDMYKTFLQVSDFDWFSFCIGGS